MNTLRTLLKPPVFEDEAKTQQAYMLHIILWTLVLVPIPFAIYTLVIAQENTARAIAQIAFGESVNIFLLILLRRGYVRLASVLQVSLFWVFFTITALTDTRRPGRGLFIGLWPGDRHRRIFAWRCGRPGIHSLSPCSPAR